MPVLIPACGSRLAIKFPDASALKRVAQPDADWSEGPVWMASAKYLLFGAAATADNDAMSLRTTLYKVTPEGILSVFAPLLLRAL